MPVLMEREKFWLERGQENTEIGKSEIVSKKFGRGVIVLL